MKKSFVVSICGIDGSGKSTQLKMLNDSLNKLGMKVKMTKAPMLRTKVLFDVSKKLFGDPYAYHPNIPPELMNTVIACDVAYHYMYNSNDFNDYDIILCDRHKLCYLAYSDAFGGEIKWVEEILSLVKEPDLVFYIDTPVNISIERINSRLDKPLRADEDPVILESALQAYKQRISNYNNIITVNGNRDKLVVHNEILSELISHYQSANGMCSIEPDILD